MTTRPPASSPLIEASRVTREFRGRLVLRGIDLAVSAGEVVVVFGPNGAGKTTLLRILSTLLRPTSGSVAIGGQPISSSNLQQRRLLGVVGHQTMLYDDLSAEENLAFYADLYEVPSAGDRIDWVLDVVGLFHRRRDRVREFSRGMHQRLSLARAILHDPHILLLDEPDSGLDVQGSAAMQALIADLATNHRCIIMISHDIELGLSLATRVVVVRDGKIAIDRPRADYADGQFSVEYSRLVAEGGK